jgi:hypothetical protein
MKRLGKILGVIILLALLVPLFQASSQASLKYKKETGKKCTFCHTGIPKKGDEDPQLNPDGQKFKANNYKLTEDQKKKP